MPIEDLVGNTELLKRVLEHYRYRLDNFTSDEEIKPLISGPVRRYLTFGQLKSQVSEALIELTKDRDTANLKLPLYSDLLRSAARQYVKDLERINEKASQELLDTKLTELELDISREGVSSLNVLRQVGKTHRDAERGKKMAVMHAFDGLQRKAKARAIKDEHVDN